MGQSRAVDADKDVGVPRDFQLLFERDVVVENHSFHGIFPVFFQTFHELVLVQNAPIFRVSGQQSDAHFAVVSFVQRNAQPVQNVLGKRVKKPAFLTAVYNGRVVIQSENHPGQQREYYVLEAHDFAAERLQVPNLVIRKGFPGFRERGVVRVAFPDQHVDVGGESVEIRGVQVRGGVQVEEVAEMVVHVDCYQERRKKLVRKTAKRRAQLSLYLHQSS